MKILSRAIIFSLLVGIIISVILYFEGKPVLDLLRKTDLTLTIWIMLLTLPYIALAGWVFAILSRIYQFKIHKVDWIGLSFIASFINQLLPYRPGMVVRFIYLKQHYRMTFLQYSAIMFIFLLLYLICGLLFFSLGLIYIDLPKVFYDAYYIGLCVFIIVFLSYILVKKRFNLHSITQHPFILLASFSIMVLIQIIAAVMLYYSFIAINAQFSFLNCIFMTGLISIAMLFSITPGNIGVLETLLGTLTHLIANDFTIGFTAMALLRACQCAIVFLFGAVFSLKLLGKSFPRISTLIDVGDKSNFV